MIYVLDEPDITTSTTQTARPHNPLTHVENTPGKAQDNRGEHEPGAALVQVGGVVALAVQGVGGDHQPGRVDAGGGQVVDQRGEHGDLVGLRADLDLAEDELVTVGGRGQQVHLGAVGGDRAAHRLPVDCDREQWPVDLLDRFGVACVPRNSVRLECLAG